MRSAPFFSTDKGKVCGALGVIAVLCAGLALYRVFCDYPQGDVAKAMGPEANPTEEHAQMYESLKEQTRLLETLQHDVDEANRNLDEISAILQEKP